MNFKKGKASDADGTCLQGFISVPYDMLVKVLGEPHSDGDGYKIDAEWILKFNNGTVATIYNYKDGPNYLGESGTPVEDIVDWHIGGHEFSNAEKMVRELFYGV